MIEKLYLSEDFRLIVLDQLILPFKRKYISCKSFDEVLQCIINKQINGNSLIPVALLYGLCMDLMVFKSQNKKNLLIHFANLIDSILKIDTSSQILYYCVSRLENFIEYHNDENDLVINIIELIEDLFEEDAEISKRIALNGSELIASDYGILLYGNGNQFNTCGEGSTTGIVKEAAKRSKDVIAFVLESRTGTINSKLTAYDLDNSGINYTIISGMDFSDLIKDNSIDCAFLNAKSVSSDGSFISDSGSYNIAVNCAYHRIPLYVIAPGTSINFESDNFEGFEPEEIDEKILNEFCGIQLYPENYPVLSLKENLIDSSLVTAIITENKIHYPPYNFKRIQQTFRSYINSIKKDFPGNN